MRRGVENGSRQCLVVGPRLVVSASFFPSFTAAWLRNDSQAAMVVFAAALKLGSPTVFFILKTS